MKISSIVRKVTGVLEYINFSELSNGKNRWVVMKSSGIPGKSCLDRRNLNLGASGQYRSLITGSAF